MNLNLQDATTKANGEVTYRMENSTGDYKNDKGSIQDKGDPNKKAAQRKIKNAKSKPNGKKRAYKFVGDRAYNNDSEHEQ